MPNQLVQWWRDTRPEDASLSDDDITVKIANAAPDYKAQGRDIFAEYPDFASDYEGILKGAASEYRKGTATLSGEVGRGLSRGLTGLKSTAYGLAALTADAIPGKFADPVRDAMIQRYKAAQAENEAEEVTPAVGSYKDVRGVRDAAQYVSGLVGEALPSLGEAVATGVAGAAIGTAAEPGGGTVVGGVGGIFAKQAAKRLIAKEIAGFTAKEIEDAALRGIGSEALKQLVKAETRVIASTAGATIANTLNSYGLSAGEIYGDLATNPNVNPEDALGIAITAAVPAAIADTALPGYVIAKSGVLGRLAGKFENFGETERRGFMGYVARLSGEALKTVPLEGGTEAFQELVNIAAKKYAETGKFDLSLTEKDKEQIINAAAGGAAGGLAAAPMASLRLNKQEAKQEEKPAENAAEKPAVSTEAATTEAPAAEAAKPAEPETAKDVLETEYGINVDGIKDLARRKMAGDEVSAEEEKLRPEERRRYQQEVLAQSEEKAKATVASEPVSSTETTAEVAKPNEEVVAQSATPVQSATPTTNANQVQGSVEVPGSPAPEATAQVAGGSPDEVQQAAGAPEGQSQEVKQPLKVDEKTIEKQRKDYESKIAEISSQISELEKMADEATTKKGIAVGLMNRYDQADEAVKKQLQPEVDKYGGLDALGKFIADADVLQRNQKTGRPTLYLQSKRGAGGDKAKIKTVAGQINALFQKQQDLQNQLNLLGKGITADEAALNPPSSATLSSSGESDTRDVEDVVQPGDEESDGSDVVHEVSDSVLIPMYYDTSEDIDASNMLNELTKSYSSEKDPAKKEKFADQLGAILSTGSRASGTGSAFSKRLTAWINPGDGTVILSTTHKRPEPTADSRYRFGFADKTIGITALLDAGYQPYASVLLANEKRTTFQQFPNLEAFNAEFGHLKQMRNNGMDINGQVAHSDGTKTVVDLDAPTPAIEVDEKEFEQVKDILSHITDEALEWARKNDGINDQNAEAFSKETLVGRMLHMYSMLAESAKNGAEISAELGRQFAQDVVNLAKVADVDLDAKDASEVVKVLPDYLSGIHSKISRSTEFFKTQKNTFKKAKVNDQGNGSAATQKAPESGAATETPGDGVNNSQGNSEVAKGSTETQPAQSQASEVQADSSSGQRANVADIKKAGQRVEEIESTLSDLGVLENEDISGPILDPLYSALKEKDLGKISSALAEAESAIQKIKNEGSDTTNQAAPEDKELADGRATLLSKVDTLLAAGNITQEVATTMRNAIGMADKAGLVQVGLEIANASETVKNAGKSRRTKRNKQTQKIQADLKDGVITADESRELQSEASSAQTAEDQAVVDEKIREAEKPDANTPNKMSQADPSAIEEVDMTTGAITPPELVPNSIENIKSNIDRQAKPGAKTLKQSLNLETITEEYKDLTFSLFRIAGIAAAEGTPMGYIRAAVARAMSDRLNLIGANLTFADKSENGNLLGMYDGKGNITIFVGAHTSEADLQATILEETIHAFTSRIRSIASVKPQALNATVLECVSGIESLIEIAKKAGLTWQDSESTDQNRVFDEFVAACVRDGAFQKQLDNIKYEVDLGYKKSTTLFEAFRLQLSKLINSLISKWRIFGNDGEPVKMTGMEAAFMFVNALIENHQRIATDSQSSTEDNTRFRYVDGSLGTGTELTVDNSEFTSNATSEAKRLMALQNLLQSATTKMVKMWESKGNNRTTTNQQALSVDQAVKAFILSAFKESTPLPSEAKVAINDALKAQGAATISENITMADLEQRSDAPKVARDGLNALNAVLFNMRKMRSDAEEFFGKKNALAKIAEMSLEINELTKKFEDMTFIGKELVKEIRRSMNESEDHGAGSFAKQMGLNKGRKASLQNAETWIRSNLPAFTDAVTALAELGVDVKTMPATDILKKVQTAATTNATIAPLLDIGRLSLALQFANRRPMVMNLLATRRSGEAGALRSIINMAMSGRDDAFDIARRDLSKLQRIGAIGARILDELKETKDKHRQMLDQAKMHAEREQFAVDAEASLTEQIKSLERMLQMESASITGTQWKAHHNAVYYVPESPNQKEGEVFSNSPKSMQMRTLKIGSEFDGAKVKQDMEAMKAWLDANANLKGTSNYNLMVRQIDGLTKVYAEECDANIRRGPLGVLVRALGSSADRLDQLGLRPAKEAANMMRRYVAGFEQSLKSIDAKGFHEFDALMRQGVDMTGMHPQEFKRQYYNRALGYLESRQDLLNPSLSFADQESLLIKEAIKFMERTTPMSQELKDVVTSLLSQAGRNGETILGENRVKFGLKVREVMKDGRVYLREPIGHPLSTAARGLHREMRVLANRMHTAWKTPFDAVGVTQNSLVASSVKALYESDPKLLRAVTAIRFTEEVMNRFVQPLINKTGKTNFDGPEKLGIVDAAQRRNLMEAYRLCGGDIVTFAEELHRLEGGDPSNLSDFVGKTISRFQGYASQLFSIADTAGTSIDEDSDPGLNFLNARQGEDFPWEWLDYKEYGYRNRTRYLRVMAQQAAFGDGNVAFGQSIEEAKRQLDRFQSEYEQAHLMLKSGNKAEYERILNEGGNKLARQNAAANLMELNSIEKRHDALMKELNGVRSGGGVFSEILGVISGMTVQGFATAATDSVTLFEAPLRKFGFSKEAIQFIGGTWKALGTEVAGTLAQAFGMQFHQDTATQHETEVLNNYGLADSDAITGKRGFQALHERYIEELGDELTYSAITNRYKNERITMAKELARAAAVRAAKVGKVFLEAGIGQAKDENQSFSTLKVLNPFTQASLWMHRAVARQWLRTVNNAIIKAEIYFKAHPADASNPNFKFTHKELGYSGKTLTGLKLDNRAWEYLNEKLAQSGISLEEAARKKMRGVDPLDFSQIQSTLSLAQTEILLNSSPVTRPAWSQDTLAGRIASPLVGWALYKSADMAKAAAGPKSKGDAKAFASFMEAMMLGVLPVSLAYAFLRDKYEEDILKKKQNVLPMKADATLPAAVLDATARLGVFGILGEIPNSIVNQATQREVSIDSRVFAVSSALNLMKSFSTAYNQGGTITYQSVVRPMMQAVGGSGYIQNFDLINGLTGMDNVESRLARRINVGNELRVAGRMNNIEIRGGRGMVTTSNRVKPHVVNMVLSAYANDPRTFRENYQKALRAAMIEYPGMDPYEKVANSFEAQHPLKSVFATRPTTLEYQRMLRSLGNESTEVATAIRNLNAYGQQVLTKRGGSGIKPFVGTDAGSKKNYRELLAK